MSEPGRGGRREEVAAPALEPAGQQALAATMCARTLTPSARSQTSAGVVDRAGHDPGVRAEQVDRPEGPLCARDEIDDLRLVGDVAADADRALAELGGDGLRARFVEVGDDDAVRALLGDAPGQRPRRCPTPRR